MNSFQCSMQYAQGMNLQKTHSTVIFHSQNQEKQNYKIFLHHSSVTPRVSLQTLLHRIQLSDPRRRPTHISPDILWISAQHPPMRKQLRDTRPMLRSSSQSYAECSCNIHDVNEKFVRNPCNVHHISRTFGNVHDVSDTPVGRLCNVHDVGRTLVGRPWNVHDVNKIPAGR